MSNKFFVVTTGVLIFLSFLFFWPITPNFFSSSKQLVVLLATVLVSLTFFITIFTTKFLKYRHSSLSLAILLFGGSILTGLLVNTEGRPEAVAGKGGLLLALSIFSYLTYIAAQNKTIKKTILKVVSWSASLLALHALLTLTIGSKLTFLPLFMQSKSFTPTGDYVSTLIIIIVGLAICANRLKMQNSAKAFNLIQIVLGTITAVAIISLMLPGGVLTPTFIPYRETWAITLDALKSTRSLFFGIGLSNYASLFTAVKPLSLNGTSLWNIVPQTGTSEFLTILTTAGLFGGISLLYLFITALKAAKKTSLYIPLIITIIALVMTPATIPVYVLFFVLIAGLHENEQSELNVSQTTSGLIALSGIAIALALFVYSIKPIISEYYIGLSQAALKNNDGKAVYDLHQQAIKYSPRTTAYRMSYAEVNLILASSLSQKPSLSDQEKETISQLVQQAVTEAKNATTLRPNYSPAWVTLAKIYRNLINVAEGADTFAVDNYAKAVALNPADPTLRIEFGGLFYQLGTKSEDVKTKEIYFSRSQSEFQTAIQLKPTLPNAYYNLSKLLETVGDNESAYLAMQKAISLLGPDNSELGRATAELETLKAKLPKASPTPSPSPAPTNDQFNVLPSDLDSSDLATPSPLPSPLPGGEIEL
jgi:tetratricopeptide (TPR) repeat protein